MEERIIEIIAQVIKNDKDYLTQHIEDQGLWDSLKLVEIVFALEDEFDIIFDENEIAEMKSIGKVCKYVSGKVE